MTTQLASHAETHAAAVGEEFEVLLVKDARDPGYAVLCLPFPGCNSQGDDREEALAMIADAIQGFLLFSPPPQRQPYDKESLIAEYIADGCTVEIAAVLVKHLDAGSALLTPPLPVL